MSSYNAYGLQRVASTTVSTRTPSKYNAQSTGGCSTSSSSGGGYQSWGGASTCSSSSSMGGAAAAAAGTSIATIVTYVLVIAACIILFLHTWQERHRQSAASDVSTVLGQSAGISRSRLVEMQILHKEEQIAKLKKKLEDVLNANAVSAANLQTQEAVIRQLQQRRDSETVAKEKAGYALREKAQALDHCKSQSKLMQLELKHCTQDWEQLKSDVRQWRSRVGL